MKRALAKLPDVRVAKNDSLLKLAQTPEWHRYQKFTIVRHPIQRLQSLQAMLLEQKGVVRSIHQILDLVEDPKMGYKFGPLDQYIKRHALPITHHHYQIWNGENIQVDRWWKLEQLADHKSEIEQFLGHPLTIPILNRTQQREEPTASEIDRIKQMYKLDIQLFYTP